MLQGDLGSEVKVRRAKKCKNVSVGICHVLATFNNTKISISDANGAVLSWSSAGKNNFRGSRKSTAYAAQVATQDAARAAMAHGLKELDVYLKGPGPGRDAAVRALQTLDLQVNSIRDVTPLPHNGCRPKRPRRP
ncbi:MAG: 30S ribosomal protein S11 [Puniceicoccales bacterium]|nr:30S ribosomal protein S11 [Puniceicoccales bacterium]